MAMAYRFAMTDAPAATTIKNGTESIRVIGGLNPGWKVGEVITWPTKSPPGRKLRIVKAKHNEIVVEPVRDEKS